MEHDRTDEEDGLTLPHSTTRKHRQTVVSTRYELMCWTELLGFDGLVLEVTESAHIVSIMLF